MKLKVKLNNRELIDFFDAMKKISETEKNKKMFTNALIYNEEKLKADVNSVLGCAIPSPEYSEYEKKRGDLIEKYAERDEDGNMVVDETSRLIKIKIESYKEAKEKFDSLAKEYSGIIQKRQKDLQEYYDLLDEEVEIEIKQVSIDYFPDYINKVMMRALKPMVKEETDEL